ncbi:MAG: terminase, partial [Terriglobales bacterium]
MSSVAADVAFLVALGNILDHKLRKYGSVRELFIRLLLMVRDKAGRLVALLPNRAQKEFERKHGQRNIVLKARQLGMTTWVAARFFIDTITRRGTLSVQVAHDQTSAEEIFRIVHRFLENLPGRLRDGALRTSRANVRQIAFPELDSEYRVETAADPNAGRGLTIRNLHASEVARWPRDAAGTLASLRAAVPPDGEVVLESTPSGAG